MFEKITTFIFWLSDIFTPSRDPFLAEYRKHLRQMITFGMLALLGFVWSLLMEPTDAPVTGLQLVIKNLYEFFYLGSLVVTLFATIGFSWAAYRYMIFVEKME